MIGLSKTWLILDVSYLCHRAFYKMGTLETDGVLMGAVYGVFRDLGTLQNLFDSRSPVFCFDMGYDKRLALAPNYKETRRNKQRTPEEQTVREELSRQLRLLRTKYLPTAGYRNILAQEGYEADDLIAAACAALPPGDDAVIVSADEDLWQLLSPDVICYNPTQKKAMTLEKLRERYGIWPGQWASVKALAGCDGDSVYGLKGIGDKTAAKWFAGALKPGTVAHGKITADGIRVHNENIKLTRLPFPGVAKVALVPDVVTRERWEFVCEKLKFGSLRELGVL